MEIETEETEKTKPVDQLIEEQNNLLSEQNNLLSEQNDLLREQNDLLREQNENQQVQRRFEIFQRERAMTEAEKRKRNAAIGMGICFISTICAIKFNGLNPVDVVQQEIDALYSWPTLVEYFKDLGPLTVFMVGGIVAFANKYLRESKQFEKLKNQFADIDNASIKKRELKSNLQTLEKEKMDGTLAKKRGLKYVR